MKNIFFFTPILVILFYSCGPAAEDRALMMSRAKIVQDSIASSIQMSIKESEMPSTNLPVINTPTSSPVKPLDKKAP